MVAAPVRAQAVSVRVRIEERVMTSFLSKENGLLNRLRSHAITEIAPKEIYVCTSLLLHLFSLLLCLFLRSSAFAIVPTPTGVHAKGKFPDAVASISSGEDRFL